MPALANPRHERFAQELAKGKNQAEAYIEAGYRGDRTAASRLSTDVNIRRRVTELKNRGAMRVEVTLASLLVEAEEARQLAMQLGQPAAAVAAIKEKGVLSGNRVEKSERKTVSDARTLTDAELDAAIAEALAREQAEAGGSIVTH